MMNADFAAIEIGTLTPVLGVTFVAGRPVTMTSSGVNVPVATSRVLGLIKENYIAGVIDECNSGGLGIYGAGRCSVLVDGIATVQQIIINGTSYSVYDQTLTYHTGDVMFANIALGVLSNANSTSTQAGCTPDGQTNCRVGICLSAPNNPANGDPLQLTVRCGN